MVQSMTGFAAVTGEAGNVSWSIEVRGVNAKGLDIRVRAPEKLLAQESKVKELFTKKFSRGNISIGIRIERGASDRGVSLDDNVLDAYLNAAIAVRARARNLGLKLNTSSAAEILALRGVLRTEDEVTVNLPVEKILATIGQAADEFERMRVEEGTSLFAILSDQLGQIEGFVAQASNLAEARKDQVATTLRANLAKIIDNTDGVDEARITQELALLAVKSDVTEEIDRLGAHISAARALLSQDGAIGRKLDFLMQEFNREANTLCSKSQNTDLTQCGLDLKATIDQMREQVQNVE